MNPNEQRVFVTDSLLGLPQVACGKPLVILYVQWMDLGCGPVGRLGGLAGLAGFLSRCSSNGLVAVAQGGIVRGVEQAWAARIGRVGRQVSFIL